MDYDFDSAMDELCNRVKAFFNQDPAVAANERNEIARLETNWHQLPQF